MKAIFVAFLVVAAAQQIHDGYPTLFNNYRSMSTEWVSFIRFANQIDQYSAYLSSFTYELYMRLKPNGRDQNTITGVVSILDCPNFLSVTLTNKTLAVWQVGDSVCRYTFQG